MMSNHLLKLFYDIILVPSLRYPDKWKPAFLAMQLGFVAGGFGLLGRDLLFYLTVQNWESLVLSELFFASFMPPERLPSHEHLLKNQQDQL